MRRALLAEATRPGRRGGLALPTALAALVCGVSVLFIAVSGTVALGGGEPVAIEVGAVVSPGASSAARPDLSAAAPSTPPPAVHSSNASGLPPEGALRTTAGRYPAVARTATEFAVDAAAVAAPAVSVIEPPATPSVAPCDVGLAESLEGDNMLRTAS